MSYLRIVQIVVFQMIISRIPAIAWTLNLVYENITWAVQMRIESDLSLELRMTTEDD